MTLGEADRTCQHMSVQNQQLGRCPRLVLGLRTLLQEGLALFQLKSYDATELATS